MKYVQRIIGAFSLMLMMVNLANALPAGKKAADIWVTDFEDAVRKAAVEHKLIFMSFSGSD